MDSVISHIELVDSRLNLKVIGIIFHNWDLEMVKPKYIIPIAVVMCVHNILFNMKISRKIFCADFCSIISITCMLDSSFKTVLSTD